MYDIKPLEDEWKAYKKGRRKPYLIGSVALLSAGVGIVLFTMYGKMPFPSVENLEISKPINSVTLIPSTILLSDTIKTIQVKEKEKIVIIKPTVQLNVNKAEEDIPTLPIVNEIPILEVKPKRKKVRKQPNRIYVQKKKIEKPRKKMHLNIIESSSVSAYKDVEKRFYQSHDTDDSLFLAKSYYRKGNYKKSEYWSLQTNKVNSHIEESWLIFAKSKVKLGRKNEAIRVLKSYIKRSNSRAANNLLYKLKKIK